MAKQTKRELPYAEIEISFQPHHPTDCDQILEWMAIENQRSIQAGLGKLYDPISKEDFSIYIPQQKMLFFYIQKILLGFVRVYELQKGYWEIMSAISNPEWRKSFTGFNRLFQQEALLQIERLSLKSNQKVREIFIVTYHPAVSASIERMILTSSPFYWKQHKFDFSAMRKLSAEKIIKLRKILRLSFQKADKTFVFELKNCLQRIGKSEHKEKRFSSTNRIEIAVAQTPSDRPAKFDFRISKICFALWLIVSINADKPAHHGSIPLREKERRLIYTVRKLTYQKRLHRFNQQFRFAKSRVRFNHCWE